jgi:hypothetical protein
MTTTTVVVAPVAVAMVRPPDPDANVAARQPDGQPGTVVAQAASAPVVRGQSQPCGPAVDTGGDNDP